MTRLMQEISHEDVPRTLPGYRLIWLKAQYARKQERLSKLDILSLAGLSIVGIAGLARLLVWRFPKILAGVVDITGVSLPDFKNVFSNGAPFAVIIGVVFMVWALTRDSFFAEK